MAIEIPEIEPQTLVCGDRWQWTRSFSNFSAADFTLTYYLRGRKAGAAITIAATADGTNFDVDVAKTVTAEYTPDVYFWSAYISDADDRQIVGQGRVEVKEDPAVEFGEGYDGRSNARKIVEALDATILKRALTDKQRYTVQSLGVSIDRMTPEALLKLRDYYKAIVDAEDKEMDSAYGRPNGDLVLARFRAPR